MHDRSTSTKAINETESTSSNGRGVILAMATACGLVVANIYYNQPMLELIERTFPNRVSVAGFVPTATQLGFALGLLFLVPLGDRLDRRRLILLQLAGLALSLAVTAVAPDAYTLVAASILVGVMSSVAQQIVPFAAELAEPGHRGAVIGTVMSGLLCGILFGRAVAGTVGEHLGWRSMFMLGCVLAVFTGILLAIVLPASRPASRARYAELLKSLVSLWRSEPTLRRATLIQACLFGSFSALWTVLALYLDARYHLGAQVAGLFGIVGAVGVLFAPVAGRIADQRGPYAIIGTGAVIMLASWVMFGAWNAVAALVVGVILLDFGEQGALISNQHVIYALRPDARNRLNTIFMGGMFVGGAAGSAGASLVWEQSGWTGVCGFGVLLVLVAILMHARGRLPRRSKDV